MTTSAPSARAARTGTSVSTPPSISVVLPDSTGTTAPGTLAEACTACPTSPSTTISAPLVEFGDGDTSAQG
jgi:hypothetical protein